MRDVMASREIKQRAEHFRYVSLRVSDDTLRATYELDERTFEESVTFEGVGSLRTPAASALAHLWYLLAGLSYYKAGAARRIDLGRTPLGPYGRALLEASILDGLAEFAYHNDLSLNDVEIVGGTQMIPAALMPSCERVLIPFGGGIDSVVTTTQLNEGLEKSLFVVSPASGRFDPLETTASVTGLDILRASRRIDSQLLANDNRFFNGHVPITAMVTLLACIAAAASDRGAVIMSNEHSASIPNLTWHARGVNHQWSKSWDAELLIAAAVRESIGPEFVVASFLRDRSELWVAEVFSRATSFHHVFRSCNRAFNQRVASRLDSWCGECDKCLFINLMLAPFLSRRVLHDIFGHEPLSDPRREQQLRVLVGASTHSKPFECVGDPDECGVALVNIAEGPEWRDVALVADVAAQLQPRRSFDEMLQPEGPSRVPAHWLR
ncbi:MAG: hypothetical protein ACYCPT_02610 [Acidimicrobiales bacterium]